VSIEEQTEAGHPPLAIPRVIYQTYSTRRLPEEIEDNITHLKEQNPTFEYCFFDDTDVTDFIRDEFGDGMLRLFLKIRPEYGAARADFFRYLLMYTRGGVYLDLKSSTSQPLELSLRPDDVFVLAHWANRPGEEHAGYGTGIVHPLELPEGELQQWHIICAPQSRLLEAVIEQTICNIANYTPWAMGVGTIGTFTVTGPVCYTKALLPLLGTHKHRRVRTNAEIGLIYSIYSDPSEHQKLAAKYYRSSTGPIVIPDDRVTELKFRAFEVAWRVRRKAETIMTGRWIAR
jgi:hypothetical protein